VRRTTTVDLLRPDGPLGVLAVECRGRDLVVAPDGSHLVAGGASCSAAVDFLPRQALTGIRTHPDRPQLQELLGVTVGPGFRRRVGEVVPQEVADQTLLHLLLDDLPGAVLVSGYSVQTAEPETARSMHEPAAFMAGRADLCAGFRTDGTMLVGLRRDGILPVVTGPPAPDLDRDAPPDSWHPIPELEAHGVRRRRRLDIVEGDVLRANAMFRDTHRSAAGIETVIHEYTLDVELDPGELRVLAIQATPRVLPWVECPVAARSAETLVGRTTGDLRSWVRTQLLGTSTCTHLNDLLRSLSDVDHLVSLMRSGLSGR
jgi:hypothetical protein